MQLGDCKGKDSGEGGVEIGVMVPGEAELAEDNTDDDHTHHDDHIDDHTHHMKTMIIFCYRDCDSWHLRDVVPAVA